MWYEFHKILSEQIYLPNSAFTKNLNVRNKIIVNTSQEQEFLKRVDNNLNL